jgi:hypothetical protein
VVRPGVKHDQPQGGDRSHDSIYAEPDHIQPVPTLLEHRQLVPLHHQVHVVCENERQGEGTQGARQAHEVAQEWEYRRHQGVHCQVPTPHDDSEHYVVQGKRASFTTAVPCVQELIHWARKYLYIYTRRSYVSMSSITEVNHHERKKETKKQRCQMCLTCNAITV